VSDIFREVEQDVRRERLEKFWNAYGLYVIGLLVLIVIGIGGYKIWQRYDTAQRIKASVAFDAALHIVNPDEAAAAFTKLAGTAPGIYGELARLGEANSFLAGGQATQAIALYKQIAAADSGAVGAVARIRAAWVMSEITPRAELATFLQPLTGADNPWRQMANEVLAYSDYRSGQAKAAASEFDALANDPQSPDALRSRARAFAAFLHGGGAVNYGTVPPPAPVVAPGTPGAPAGAAAP
jgi:hypothetical protein